MEGVHRTYVLQLERYVANISINGLEKLTHALDMDISTLFALITDEKLPE